jgi:DNA polymerase III psi subunit
MESQTLQSQVEPFAPVPSVPVEKPQAIAGLPELNFAYRGKNARNILILVYDEVNEVTTEAGREVFKNIVKAKNLSANDYAIVNYASYKNSTFNELRSFFNAKAILTFGVRAMQLGISDYPQHAVVTHEGVQLMFSADLHELSMDVNIKKALWSVLKQMEL